MDWNSFFDNWGLKTVAPNDVAKKAYVPNADQRKAIDAAGMMAGDRHSQPITLHVLLEPGMETVMASYYLTLRSEKAGRNPEARMGRGLFGEWLRPGDDLLLGNIGSRLYVLKTSRVPEDDAGAERLASALPADLIHARAAAAAGRAQRRSTSRMEFIRNPYVVAAALLRAGGCCEMPDCAHELFRRGDGTPYLEVHHLVPLAEDGPDTLSNVAALCPSCHRELHHGARRVLQTALVLAHVATIPAAGQP